jgi:hypothetical protein
MNCGSAEGSAVESSSRRRRPSERRVRLRSRNVSAVASSPTTPAAGGGVPAGATGSARTATNSPRISVSVDDARSVTHYTGRGNTGNTEFSALVRASIDDVLEDLRYAAEALDRRPHGKPSRKLSSPACCLDQTPHRRRGGRSVARTGAGSRDSSLLRVDRAARLQRKQLRAVRYDRFLRTTSG